jgi:nucleoside-diphosphate-sugar epimerase
MGMKRAPYRTAQVSPNPLARDLDHVLAHTAGIWDEFRGKRIFISGGTGFFGTWLLESFAWAQDRLDLRAEVMVLTRNKEAFAKKAPHLAAHRAIRFVTGDVRGFQVPEGRFDYVIHGAVTSGQELGRSDALLAIDTIVTGTRNMLQFATDRQAERFLFISSGAVYGKQLPHMSHIPESYAGAPMLQDVQSKYNAYGEAKRLGELLCFIYHDQYALGATVARCFTFVGPYLRLDLDYAVGNFIRDVVGGRPISITGDGTPYRSYLYAADLAVWLWTLLAKGQARQAYNVGSERAVTIGEVAACVAACVEPTAVVVRGKERDPAKRKEQYVPSTEKARQEFGLSTFIDLEESIRRTVEWYLRYPAPASEDGPEPGDGSQDD